MHKFEQNLRSILDHLSNKLFSGDATIFSMSPLLQTNKQLSKLYLTCIFWMPNQKFKSWMESNAGLSWSWLFALMKSMNLLPLCPSRPFPQSSLFDSNWLELRNGIIVPLFLACPQLWSSIVIHNNKNLCTYILTTSTLKLVDSLLNKSHKNCPRNRLIIAHNLLPKSSLKLNAECRKL